MENSYKTIEVTIGNFVRKFEMRENYVTTFVVRGRVFHVIGTDHTLSRLGDRGVDSFHIASSILALGAKLLRYNNSGKHIIISDEDKEVSTVFTVENSIVVLITVLDKGQMWASDKVGRETIIETFGRVS
jgi:hypothetical protein